MDKKTDYAPLYSKVIKELGIKDVFSDEEKLRIFYRFRKGVYNDGYREFVKKESRAKNGYRILDAGGNLGNLSYPLAKKNASVTVIDIDDFSLEIGKRLFSKFRNMEFKHMDLTKLDFEDNHFDEIICCETIEHIDKKYHIKVIGELYRVLKKGGRLLLSTPNKHLFNIMQFLARLKNREFQNLFSLVHTEDLTYFELKKLLNGVGFRTFSIKGKNHLISSENPLLGIGLVVKAVKDVKKSYR